MRISASGEQSMMVVAIDQILRLAPSISGPIEPVVSSTNTTSTTGLADFGGELSAMAAGATREKASAIACATMCRSMTSPPGGARPWIGIVDGIRDRLRSQLRRAIG